MLLGGAWVRGALELAIARTGDGSETTRQASLSIVRLGLEGATSERAISSERLFDGFASGTPAELAYRGEDGWHFLLREQGGHAPSPVWDVSEKGAQRATGVVAGERLSAVVDAAAVGRVRSPSRVEWVLQSDGRLLAPPEVSPIPPGWRGGRCQGTVQVVAGQQRSRPCVSFSEDERCGECPNPGRMEPVGGRQLTVRCPDFDLFVWAGLPDGSAYEPVASMSCGAMVQPTAIERSAGGYWVVDYSGGFVGVDADLRRADPFPLLDHLLSKDRYFYAPSGPVLKRVRLRGPPSHLGQPSRTGTSRS